MELHLKITGYILLLLSLLHVFFPRYFNWKKEFSQVSLLSRQVMYVHTFFIGLMIFLMGLCCINAAEDILHTRLGHLLALGFFVFWFCRLFFQFFVYSSALWKGKRFETAMHILFSFIWGYFSIVFLLVWWGN
ncbi:hypothetical protein HGH92_07690 [Chitinophaga varians]|uniref:Uncharacterized protein n=1 Tax=Chitinophaga varians TaxID=2202339 RepID=A0A847RR31_9BACT|nr:hypothetical protein [Chitinophaga varians]NLR64184.1 hypothetical protein [Chitinophaga varians]